MLPIPLVEVYEALLLRACAERWPETMTLEFKRDLPGGSDKEKFELCKDVAAMANADGGDIVYGIDEESGAASALVPITVEPADNAKRRLGQVLASVEPRIAGLHLQEVAVAGGYALVVRVPASFDGPHRFNNRFVSRTNTHTNDMTYDQLRSAFGRGATLEASARTFTAERRAALRHGETWADRRGLPTCMAHLVPMSAFTHRGRPDMQAAAEQFDSLSLDEWRSGVNSWLNLDGLVVFPGGPDVRVTYVQAFRNGAFEAVRHANAINAPLGERWMSATVVTSFFRDALLTFLRNANAQGTSGPAIFSISLHNVAGYTWWMGQAINMQTSAVADRNDMVIPDIWIEDLASGADPDALLRPLFDVLWQAFRMDRCALFNAADGRWTAR